MQRIVSPGPRGKLQQYVKAILPHFVIVLFKPPIFHAFSHWAYVVFLYYFLTSILVGFMPKTMHSLYMINYK